MTGQPKRDALGGVPLFADLSDADLDLLDGLTSERDVSAGHELATQGEFGSEAMILIAGSARVLRDGSHIADLGPGDVLGEMSLITRLPRNASVFASTDSRVVVLGRAEFTALLAAHPDVTSTILQTVGTRLSRLVDGV